MKNYGNLEALKPEQRYILLRQLHKARRAGLHTDVRIGAPLLGLFSWAAPKDLPTVLNLKRLLITQPLHTYEYKDFLGILNTKYGAGTVEKLLLSPIIILLNTGDVIKFKRDAELDTPVYTMVKTKNGNWITTMSKQASVNKIKYQKLLSNKEEKTIRTEPLTYTKVASLMKISKTLEELANKKIEILNKLLYALMETSTHNHGGADFLFDNKGRLIETRYNKLNKNYPIPSDLDFDYLKINRAASNYYKSLGEGDKDFNMLIRLDLPDSEGNTSFDFLYLPIEL